MDRISEQFKAKLKALQPNKREQEVLRLLRVAAEKNSKCTPAFIGAVECAAVIIHQALVIAVQELEREPTDRHRILLLRMASIVANNAPVIRPEFRSIFATKTDPVFKVSTLLLLQKAELRRQSDWEEVEQLFGRKLLTSKIAAAEFLLVSVLKEVQTLIHFFSESSKTTLLPTSKQPNPSSMQTAIAKAQAAIAKFLVQLSSFLVSDKNWKATELTIQASVLLVNWAFPVLLNQSAVKEMAVPLFSKIIDMIALLFLEQSSDVKQFPFSNIVRLLCLMKEDAGSRASCVGKSMAKMIQNLWNLLGEPLKDEEQDERQKQIFDGFIKAFFSPQALKVLARDYFGGSTEEGSMASDLMQALQRLSCKSTSNSNLEQATSILCCHIKHNSRSPLVEEVVRIDKAEQAGASANSRQQVHIHESLDDLLAEVLPILLDESNPDLTPAVTALDVWREASSKNQDRKLIQEHYQKTDHLVQGFSRFLRASLLAPSTSFAEIEDLVFPQGNLDDIASNLEFQERCQIALTKQLDSDSPISSSWKAMYLLLQAKINLRHLADEGMPALAETTNKLNSLKPINVLQLGRLVCASLIESKSKPGRLEESHPRLNLKSIYKQLFVASVSSSRDDLIVDYATYLVEMADEQDVNSGAIVEELQRQNIALQDRISEKEARAGGQLSPTDYLIRIQLFLQNSIFFKIMATRRPASDIQRASGSEHKAEERISFQSTIDAMAHNEAAITCALFEAERAFTVASQLLNSIRSNSSRDKHRSTWEAIDEYCQAEAPKECALLQVRMTAKDLLGLLGACLYQYFGLLSRELRDFSTILSMKILTCLFGRENGLIMDLSAERAPREIKMVFKNLFEELSRVRDNSGHNEKQSSALIEGLNKAEGSSLSLKAKLREALRDSLQQLDQAHLSPVEQAESNKLDASLVSPLQDLLQLQHTRYTPPDPKMVSKVLERLPSQLPVAEAKPEAISNDEARLIQEALITPHIWPTLLYQRAHHSLLQGLVRNQAREGSNEDSRLPANKVMKKLKHATRRSIDISINKDEEQPPLEDRAAYFSEAMLKVRFDEELVKIKEGIKARMMDSSLQPETLAIFTSGPSLYCVATNLGSKIRPPLVVMKVPETATAIQKGLDDFCYFQIATKSLLALLTFLEEQISLGTSPSSLKAARHIKKRISTRLQKLDELLKNLQEGRIGGGWFNRFPRLLQGSEQEGLGLLIDAKIANFPFENIIGCLRQRPTFRVVSYQSNFAQLPNPLKGKSPLRLVVAYNQCFPGAHSRISKDLQKLANLQTTLVSFAEGGTAPVPETFDVYVYSGHGSGIELIQPGLQITLKKLFDSAEPRSSELDPRRQQDFLLFGCESISFDLGVGFGTTPSNKVLSLTASGEGAVLGCLQTSVSQFLDPLQSQFVSHWINSDRNPSAVNLTAISSEATDLEVNEILSSKYPAGNPKGTMEQARSKARVHALVNSQNKGSVLYQF